MCPLSDVSRSDRFRSPPYIVQAGFCFIVGDVEAAVFVPPPEMPETGYVVRTESGILKRGDHRVVFFEFQHHLEYLVILAQHAEDTVAPAFFFAADSIVPFILAAYAAKQFVRASVEFLAAVHTESFFFFFHDSHLFPLRWEAFADIPNI